MKKLMIAVGLAALAAPAMANADLGVRFGLETPIYTHVNQTGQSNSFSIGDTFQPAFNILAEWYPVGVLGLGVEFKEGFAASGTGYERTGTNIGPSVTLDLIPLVFFRGALPVHVEPGNVTWNFRAAGGLKFSLPLIALYVEATADFPLVGTNVTAFSTAQQFGLGAGLWLKF